MDAADHAERPLGWAFVSASGGLRVNPEFHCEISVDGQVVMSQQGGRGSNARCGPGNPGPADQVGQISPGWWR